MHSHGGSISWVECIVLDYDSSTNHYFVQLQSCINACPSPAAGAGAQHSKREADAPILAGQQQQQQYSSTTTHTPFWVPRVQLCFAAEDPCLYAKRFAAGLTAVAAAEVQMAFELCVDSMPIDDVPQLTTEQVNRVLNFALNSKKLKDRLMDTSTLINEANLEHARAMNKVTLQTFAGACTVAGSSAEQPAGAAQAEYGEQLLPLMLPPPPPAKPVPAKDTVDLAAAGYDFREQLSEFSFKTLLTKAEVIFALGKIRLESSKASATTH